MRTRHILTLTIAALALASCGSPTASVTPILASMGVNGDVSIVGSGGGATGAVSSTFDDLGLGDNDGAFGGIVRINMGSTEVSISGIGVEFAGEGVATGTFEYGGQTINAGAAVATDLGIQMARAMITWDVMPLGALDIGFGFGATLVDFDLKVRDLGTGESIETSQLMPIPLLAARVKWTWGPVALRGDVGGLLIKYDGNEASMVDAGLNASVDFLGAGDLVVGYKTMRIDAQYEDNQTNVDTDFNLEGFYFGLRLSF